MKDKVARDAYISRNKYYDWNRQEWVIKCIYHRYCKNGMPEWWMREPEKRLRCMGCHMRLWHALKAKNSNEEI